MHEETTWKKCSSCRTSIAHQARYFTCSVSTCNRPRTGLYFCSMSCWEAHLPLVRHREAWAEEKKAPTVQEAEATEADEGSTAGSGASVGRRQVVAPARPAATSTLAGAVTGVTGGAKDADVSREILIVVSKLKAYVKARSGMNTSDGAMEILSDQIRSLTNLAIRRAAQDGRRTVMDRDFAMHDVRE